MADSYYTEPQHSENDYEISDNNDLDLQQESHNERRQSFLTPDVLGEEDVSFSHLDERHFAVDEDDLRFSAFENDEGVFSSDSSIYSDDFDAHEGSNARKSIPLAYRFYRRSVYRQRSTWSIPFVLVGPNVDHWKEAGQALASAGFSAIACERVREEEDDKSTSSKLKSELNDSDSAMAILDLLDALRWNRAVLVGCDSESVLAIQAALHLAPHRVVGLVLCGTLDSAEDFVGHMQPQTIQRYGTFAVDSFLRQFVDCPTMIVWDGDKSFQDERIVAGSSTSQDAAYVSTLASERIPIRGSGYVPHRRQPEYLSWVLTRFVEEFVAPYHSKDMNVQKTRKDEQSNGHPRKDQYSVYIRGKNRNLFRQQITALFSEEGMVVSGRIVANIIFYAAAIRVGIYQYNNFRNGIFDFHTKLTMLSSAPGRLLAFLGSLFSFSQRTPAKIEPKMALEEEEMELPFKTNEEEENNQEDTDDSSLLDDDGGDDMEEDESSNDSDSDPLESEASPLSSEEMDEQPLEEDGKMDGNEEEEPSGYFRPLFFLDNVVA